MVAAANLRVVPNGQYGQHLFPNLSRRYHHLPRYLLERVERTVLRPDYAVLKNVKEGLKN